MAATVPLSPLGSRERLIGLVGALLLHALLGLAVLNGWSFLVPPATPPTVYEVAFVPAPEPPPAPLVIDAPPAPAPEAFLLPPPPVLEETAPVGPVSRPAPAPGPESARPGPAQRAEGTAREHPAPRAEPASPQVIRGGGIPLPTMRRISPPSLVDNAPFTVGRADRAAGAGGAAEAVQRNEGDFILGQVMKYWLIDYRNPRFRTVMMSGPFILNGDGTLGAPYGKGDPWRPEVMIANWAELQLPQNEPVKVALESFLRAVRAAQPFTLPPSASGPYPRTIRLHLVMGDL